MGALLSWFTRAASSKSETLLKQHLDNQGMYQSQKRSTCPACSETEVEFTNARLRSETADLEDLKTHTSSEDYVFELQSKAECLTNLNKTLGDRCKSVEDERDRTNRQNESLNMKINAIQGDLKEKDSQIDVLRNKILHIQGQLEKDTNTLELRNNDLETNLQQSEKQNAKLAARVTFLEQEAEETRADNRKLRVQGTSRQKEIDRLQMENSALDAWKKENKEEVETLQRKISELRSSSRSRENEHIAKLASMQSEMDTFMQTVNAEHRHLWSATEGLSRASRSFQGATQPTAQSTLTIVELPDDYDDAGPSGGSK